jgi:hypothetical protein
MTNARAAGARHRNKRASLGETIGSWRKDGIAEPSTAGVKRRFGAAPGILACVSALPGMAYLSLFVVYHCRYNDLASRLAYIHFPDFLERKR